MAISSDPDIRQGRWCIDGTRIDVMMLRTNPRPWLIEQYEHVPITNEMIDEALAWNFPEIKEATPFADTYMDVDCSCGEIIELDTDQTIGRDGNDDRGEYVYQCMACGRSWKVTITLEPA